MEDGGRSTRSAEGWRKKYGGMEGGIQREVGGGVWMKGGSTIDGGRSTNGGSSMDGGVRLEREV